MKEVLLEFSQEEALVLFDRLSKFNEAEGDVLDEVEQQVLYNVEAQLESILKEPLSADYKVAVERAKDQLKS